MLLQTFDLGKKKPTCYPMLDFPSNPLTDVSIIPPLI